MSEPPLLDGWCERELQQELPGLGLVATQVALDGGAAQAKSPAGLVERLRELAKGWRGGRAVALRKQPVPAAYRAFFRQVGLDPDSTPTPIEQVVLGRMIAGDFRSSGLIADALTLALVDTGVPVWALDAERIDGPLGVRASREEEIVERADGDAVLGAGRLLVADAARAVALLFDQPQRAYRASGSTRLLALYAIQVAGVPRVYVEEALAISREALADSAGWA